MNKNAIIFWGSLFVFGIIFGVIWSSIAKSYDNVNSSPVEEMYHRQLINTIDSILDSHYPCGITEDNNAYPSIDSLSTIAVPKHN